MRYQEVRMRYNKPHLKVDHSRVSERAQRIKRIWPMVLASQTIEAVNREYLLLLQDDILSKIPPEFRML